MINSTDKEPQIFQKLVSECMQQYTKMILQNIQESSRRLLVPIHMRLSVRRLPFVSLRHHFRSFAAASGTTTVGSGCSGRFSWDDVFCFCASIRSDAIDLQGFFDKINLCNRNSDKQCEFVPLVIEDQIVGYVHYGFADHLRRFKDVFIFPEDEKFGGNFGYHVSLHSLLCTSEDRTRAVADVVNCLGEELIPAISCHIVIWRASFFLIRTSCCTILWD